MVIIEIVGFVLLGGITLFMVVGWIIVGRAISRGEYLYRVPPPPPQPRSFSPPEPDRPPSGPPPPPPGGG